MTMRERIIEELWRLRPDGEGATFSEVADAIIALLSSPEAVEEMARTYDRSMRPLGSWVSLHRERRANMVAAMQAALAALLAEEGT